MGDGDKKDRGGEIQIDTELITPPAKHEADDAEAKAEGGDGQAVVQEMETIPPDPGGKEPPGAPKDGDETRREMETIPPDPGG